VTVGIADRALNAAVDPDLLDAFDILLAGDGYATPPDLDRGWVSLADRDAESLLDEVAAAVTASPLAAVTLVQVLRLGTRATVRNALIAESLAYATLQTSPMFQAWLAQRGATRRTASDTPAVVVERDDATMAIVLNRPERHNAFSAAMRDELVDALRVAASDPSIAAVTLRGAGASFSAGGDLDEFGSVPDAATGHHVRSVRSPAWWMHRLAPKIEVRAHGACIGAGIELPAFAGRITARNDAYFQLPEVAMGLIPGAGGTVSLPRRIGRHRTAWLALTSARIDSRLALHWELVDEVRTE